MEPGVKDHDIMYKLIIGQLYNDGHKQLALDLSNSIGMKPSPPPSDKLFRLVSAARLAEDDADEEKKGSDVQMSPNQVVPSINNISTGEECGDYFPFLALPSELKALVFSCLSIEDRMRARVTKSLVEIEAKNKYHVNKLFIGEKCCIRAPYPLEPMAIDDWDMSKGAQSIIFVESKSYSSDSIRRIAHNASIGYLRIELNGSSEFHREVYNLIKEIDIENLTLTFKDEDMEKELMDESFILDLARLCKRLWIKIDNAALETINLLYKILLDGSTKLRRFRSFIEQDKCISFLRLIGITYRDGTFFSNRNIEVYKEDNGVGYVGYWHIFDGHLEMILECNIFRYHVDGDFYLLHHETSESLEKAKNEEEMEKIEIDPE